MITQNFECIIKRTCYGSDLSQIDEQKNSILQRILKGENRPENLDYIKKEDVSISSHIEHLYNERYCAYIKIKISCRANFSDFSRYYTKMDTLLEEMINFLSFAGMEIDISDKIILKETVFQDNSYYD